MTYSIITVAVPEATDLDNLPSLMADVISGIIGAQGAKHLDIKTHNRVDNGQKLKGVVTPRLPETVEDLFNRYNLGQAGWGFLSGQSFHVSSVIDDAGREIGEIQGLHKALSKADCLRFQNDVTEPADDPVTRRPTEAEVIAPVVVSGASPVVVE